LSSLLDGRPVREVERGIFSVLPDDTPGQRYDRRARAYDRMIDSRLYNRVFWGSAPDEYRAFARRAVASSSSGWLLDAGCGTLLLTAEAYAAAPQRPVVALDQSIGMLQRARERLAEISGGRSEQVIFLQADLLNLPFKAHSFRTVLSMGMLHLFDAVQPLVRAMDRLVEPGGQLFLSSLVMNGRFGDRYMRLLHRAGEIATPRTAEALKRVLLETLGSDTTYSVVGNMSYTHGRHE
jgi:ubiquinone/menaquinone biosynthesis C-methylase UbiE